MILQESENLTISFHKPAQASSSALKEVSRNERRGGLGRGQSPVGWSYLLCLHLTQPVWPGAVGGDPLQRPKGRDLGIEGKEKPHSPSSAEWD